MTNPLLTDSPLPTFPSIEASHVEPAIRELLDENRRELGRLLASGAAGWDGIVAPDRAHASPAGARLVAGRPPEWRHEQRRAARRRTTPACRCSPRTTPSSRRTAPCARLTSACSTRRAEPATPASASWSRTHCAISAWPAWRCPPTARSASAPVMERLAVAQAKFDENVLDATNAWSRHVTRTGRTRRTARMRSVHRARADRRSRRPAGLAVLRSTRRTTRP